MILMFNSEVILQNIELLFSFTQKKNKETAFVPLFFFFITKNNKRSCIFCYQCADGVIARDSDWETGKVSSNSGQGGYIHFYTNTLEWGMKPSFLSSAEVTLAMLATNQE